VCCLGGQTVLRSRSRLILPITSTCRLQYLLALEVFLRLRTSLRRSTPCTGASLWVRQQRGARDSHCFSNYLAAAARASAREMTVHRMALFSRAWVCAPVFPFHPPSRASVADQTSSWNAQHWRYSPQSEHDLSELGTRIIDLRAASLELYGVVAAGYVVTSGTFTGMRRRIAGSTQG
jgi:hypothetical protein